MERTQTSELVFVVVGSILVAASVVSVLREVPCRELLAQLWSYLPKWGSETEDDTELGPIVKAKMQQLKLGQMRKVCQALCLVMSVWTGMMIINIIRGKAIRAYWGMDVVQLVGHGILTSVALHRGVLSWKTIDVIYTALILMAAIFVSPLFCEPDRMVSLILVVDHIVLCLNLVRRSMRVIIPTNFLFAVASSITFLTCGDWSAIHVSFQLAAQILFLTTFPVIAHYLEVSMASAIRKSLEMQAANELLSAASALLRTCCDVVVELDADGVIVCPALDLGGFLLRGPNCRLQNTRLVDLISDGGDRRIFLAKLEEERPEGVGLAEAIHVSMRDGNNVLVKVEILFFQFRKVDGQPRYMTGLREFCDVPRSKHGRQRAQVGVDPDSSGPDASGPDRTFGSDEEEEGSRTSRSSADSAGDDDVTAATMVVDSTCVDLRIRACSAAFQMRVARLAEGTCLRDLVMHGDDFAKWMEMAATYGSDWPAARVTFNLRQGRLTASCRVAQETGDEAIDPTCLQLQFYKIKRCRSHSDGCIGFRPHTNFRGTPVLHMAL